MRLVKTVTAIIVIMASAAAASVPNVVVTIKPIHALVSGVMDGVGTPQLLLSGGESPHTYSLRPSQAQQLHTAQLLIWVGPVLEKFLEKTVSTLDKRVQVLTLFDTPGLTRLAVRTDKEWGPHLHDTDEHQEIGWDAHCWLDPHNAKLFVATVAQTLSRLNPENTARYSENAQRLQMRLEQLDDTIHHDLAMFKDKPFLVFHDAYQYFTQRYHLMEVGSITLAPENSPSAKRLQELRHLVKSRPVRCVFSEPQFPPDLVTTVIEGSGARSGILDPVGADLPAGTEAYFTLLRHLVAAFQQCLAEEEVKRNSP